MTSRYKIKKADIKAFFSMVDAMMAGNYWEIYGRLGLKQGSNKNFFCIEQDTHSGGRDSHPSMSIDNITGQWHCFTCDIRGNMLTYWKEYIKQSEEDHYSDFIIDLLGMNASDLVRFSETEDDPDFEKNSQQMQLLYKSINARFPEANNGRPHILSSELSEMVKDLTRQPMSDLDTMVQRLLNNKERMDYLYKHRRINEEIIKKYKIGLIEEFGVHKFVFPTINAEGDFVNAKVYDPENLKGFKWRHLHKDSAFNPMPMNNFTKKTIFFFEGEPDLYCALSLGYGGAVTMGSIARKNVDTVFGRDYAKQIFSGKEIVICMDADEAGQMAAQELAESLYPYAKQIKIIDLNMSENNPNGLDPEAMKVVKVYNRKTKDYSESKKRSEKDFTDFMKKNGFGEEAKKKLNAVIDRTLAFTMNLERTAQETYKVSLSEARMAKYFSSDRSKELEIVASVAEHNSEAFLYPTTFRVRCRVMGHKNKAQAMCKTCSICMDDELETCESMDFILAREQTKENINNPRCKVISDHNILGLVQVTDSQKFQHLKRLYEISDRCKLCMIEDVENEKLLNVRLVKSLDNYEEEVCANVTSNIKNDVEVEAYVRGDADIDQYQTYKFIGTQTTAWSGQHAVLFIDKAEPKDTPIESFKMNQDIYDMLSVFRPKKGESIDDHIKRRHKVFANAAGVTGREDLFLINDLAYLSPIEVHNKMLPEVKRGWVEVIIAGDTRTGKTLITKFFHKHYKVGSIIGGSSGVSRSGLIGGIKKVENRNQISWGAFAMNDHGLVIIDEMSEIDQKVLTDLADIRSEGIAKLDKIVSGREPARTRKIMLSNARGAEDAQKEYNYGIQFLKDLCIQPRILSRFDIGCVVKSGDVKVEDFKDVYHEIETEFTEFQCRNLIMWAYSRRPEQIIFEEGFNKLANSFGVKLNKKFHSSTHLVNQEARAKIIRLSVSLATMLNSSPENDWNKILVKKEHLEYIYKFLVKLYCGNNMRMDQYSKMMYSAESLGSMTFMENICKYIDIRLLMKDSEFTEKTIQQIFCDYLGRVAHGGMYMPDAKSDETLETKLQIFESTPKLMGILISRNCLERTGRGMYKKTPPFAEWLTNRERLGEKAPTSDILEPLSNGQNSDLLKKVVDISEDRKRNKKRKQG